MLESKRLSITKKGIKVKQGAICKQADRMTFRSLYLYPQFSWKEKKIHMLIELNEAQGPLALFLNKQPSAVYEFHVLFSHCLLETPKEKIRCDGNLLKTVDKTYFCGCLNDGFSLIRAQKKSNQQVVEFRVEGLDLGVIDALAMQEFKWCHLQGKIQAEGVFKSEGTQFTLESDIIGKKICFEQPDLEVQTKVDLLETSVVMDHKTINGDLKLQQAQMIPKGHKLDPMWKVHVDDLLVQVKDSQLHLSDITASFLGMRGSVQLDLTQEEKKVTLHCEGTPDQILPFLPAYLQEPLAKQFQENQIVLDLKISPLASVIEMQGTLNIDHQHEISFGYLYGQPLQLDSELEKYRSFFMGALETQLEHKESQGWFKASNLPADTFLNPFLQQQGLVVSGDLNVEGSFDHDCLMFFYETEVLTLQSKDFECSLAMDQIKHRGVHYIEFGKLYHVGLLPFEKGCYKDLHHGVAFENIQGLFHFENEKIYLKQAKACFDDLHFEGKMELSLDPREPIYLHCDQIQGSIASGYRLLSYFHKEVQTPFSLEGTLFLKEKGLDLVFEKKQLIQASIQGGLNLEYEGENIFVKDYTMDFEYQLKENTFVLTHGKGLLIAPLFEKEATIYIPSITFSHFPEYNVFVDLYVQYNDQKVFDLLCKVEGGDEIKKIVCEGSLVECEGFQTQDEVILDHLRIQQWHGALHLQLSEHKAVVKTLDLTHPSLGQLGVQGEFDRETWSFYGAMQSQGVVFHDVVEAIEGVRIINPSLKGEIFSHLPTGHVQAKTSLFCDAVELKGQTFRQQAPVACFLSTTHGVTIKNLHLATEDQKTHLECKEIGYQLQEKKLTLDQVILQSDPSMINEMIPLFSKQIRLMPNKTLFAKGDLCWSEQQLTGSLHIERQGIEVKDYEMGMHNLSMLFDKTSFYARGSMQLKNKNIGFSLRGKYQDKVQGDLILSDPINTHHALNIGFELDRFEELKINAIEGKFLNSNWHFRQEDDGLYGIAKIDFAALGSYFSQMGWLQQLDPKGTLNFQGHLYYHPQTQTPYCKGLFSSKDFMVYGALLSSLEGKVLCSFDECQIAQLKIDDWSGRLNLENVHLFQMENRWNFFVDQGLLEDFKPSKVRSSYIKQLASKPFLRSLLVKALLFKQCFGKLDDLNTVVGHGEVHFEHQSQHNFLSNLLSLPSEITGKIGLDLSVFVPQEGSVKYEVKEEKIFLTYFKNVFSEKKRSRFYLFDKSPSYIGFDGNLNLKIKMKHYNFLMKFTEMFTFNVKGTLAKPSCNLVGQEHD